MKKEIIAGILILFILTPIFVYLRLSDQQRHALFVKIAGKQAMMDKRGKLTTKFLNIPKANNNVIIKPKIKIAENILNPEIKKVEVKDLKHEKPEIKSLWKGEKPTWNDKPVIGLKRTKLYYKPGDMGYYTYRNLRNDVDYFGTPVDAEKAGYKSARNKEEEERGS